MLERWWFAEFFNTIGRTFAFVDVRFLATGGMMVNGRRAAGQGWTLVTRQAAACRSPLLDQPALDSAALFAALTL